MAIYNTPDGRQVVGSTVAGNDYHGFNGKRDIIIQLTADGATTDGLNALEYLKAYAVEQNKQGNPIFPNGTRVWISANGYTKAVEADDIVIDGDNITIGGIKWNGSAWDYSEAGQTGSGLPSVTGDDDGKVLTVVDGAWAAANGGSGGGVLVVKFAYANGTSSCDHTFAEIHAAVTAGNPVIGCVADCDGVYRDFAYNNRGDKAKYYLRNGNLYNSSGLKTVKAEIDEDDAVTVTVQEVNV